MKHCLWLACLLLLSACGKPAMNMTDGSEPGHYQIGVIHYTLSEKLQGDADAEADMAQFKQMLETRLPNRLAYYENRGPKRDLTILVQGLRLNTSAARSILVGDAIQAWTQASLTDPVSHATLATAPVVTVSKTSAGLLGAVMNGLQSTEADENQKQVLADRYTEQLISVLYPPKE